MIFTRPAGAIMIFTRSRNAAASDNSMYCMIPDPFPSSAFGKGSTTPDYLDSWSICRRVWFIILMISTNLAIL